MTAVTAVAAPSSGASLVSLTALLGEMNDLKRVRTAGAAGTVMDRLFQHCWAALATGADPLDVALVATAQAVAAARLAGIDRAVLVQGGLDADRALGVLQRAFDSVAEPLDPALAGQLRQRLGETLAQGRVPDFALALAQQPRAGATRPGHPRLILEPPESHSEHCMAVAVYAVLLSPVYGADPVPPFLAAMSHHFHNAGLPDAGFTGEELLQDTLPVVMATYRALAMNELPAAVATRIDEACRILPSAVSPAAKAFHAADVIDRVLQMRQYARVAAFTIDQALHDLELVHVGPVQGFQLGVLAEAGLA